MSENTTAATPSETSTISPETNDAWKAFLTDLEPVLQKHKLAGMAISGVFAAKDAADENKTRLSVLSAAALPAAPDLDAVRSLALMVTRSVAASCANEVGRIAAQSVGQELEKNV